MIWWHRHKYKILSRNGGVMGGASWTTTTSRCRCGSVKVETDGQANTPGDLEGIIRRVSDEYDHPIHP